MQSSYPPPTFFHDFLCDLPHSCHAVIYVNIKLISGFCEEQDTVKNTKNTHALGSFCEIHLNLELNAWKGNNQTYHCRKSECKILLKCLSSGMFFQVLFLLLACPDHFVFKNGQIVVFLKAVSPHLFQVTPKAGCILSMTPALLSSLPMPKSHEEWSLWRASMEM